jgi:hypothetical protein
MGKAVLFRRGKPRTSPSPAFLGVITGTPFGGSASKPPQAGDVGADREPRLSKLAKPEPRGTNADWPQPCSPKGKTVNSRPDGANRDGSLFPEGENRE